MQTSTVNNIDITSTDIERYFYQEIFLIFRKKTLDKNGGIKKGQSRDSITYTQDRVQSRDSITYTQDRGQSRDTV
jgi:hypothetical protein